MQLNDSWDKQEGGNASETVTQVRLEDLVTDEDTFQWRLSGWEKSWEGKNHINDLVRHLRTTKQPFDPLVVYPHNGRLVVVDGHHRLKAYKQVWWEEPIPVKVFQGTLREARDAAFIANSKGQRPLTIQERQERAWEYTKDWYFEGKKELSKDWTTRTTGVSDGTVAKMRRTIKKYGDAARDLSWFEVMTKASDEDQPPADPDWVEKKAEQLKEALMGLNVIHYAKSPDILAMALEQISPSIPRSLVEYWGNIAAEVTEDREMYLEEQAAAVAAGRVPDI